MSIKGDHVLSANDLESTSLIIRSIAELFPKSGLLVEPAFLTEELSLSPCIPLGSDVPETSHGLALQIDPIDGSKSFDNWKCERDCPLPRPGSAISLAAVCPELTDILVSALYCFDLGDVFSSIYIGKDATGNPQYASFLNGTLLRPLILLDKEPAIEAKRRVLSGNYNSKALMEIARLELALMERGLNAAYGGLTGSTAMDIVNVVRGSFCACVDVRSLCGKGGSVPRWYDAAGALAIALGRGLKVIATDSQGQRLSGGDHDIYTPVAFVVTRPEHETQIIDAIRSTVASGFLRQEAYQVAG